MPLGSCQSMRVERCMIDSAATIAIPANIVCVELIFYVTVSLLQKSTSNPGPKTCLSCCSRWPKQQSSGVPKECKSQHSDGGICTIILVRRYPARYAREF